MCGIVGAVGNADVTALVAAAAEVQAHRGPDAQGQSTVQVGERWLSLAHQRLSILDLSDAGRQPMDSRSGRWSIVFNGEVYNYLELAEQYGLDDLRSGSDTEVVLELMERLGPERALGEFNGMWALLAHDRHTNKLYLSRDRFGKKPLYWSRTSELFFAASELKSFLAVPGVDLTPNPTVAARYLAQALQDVDTETWLSGVSAFPAGHWGTIDLSEPDRGLQDVRAYWDIGDLTPDPNVRFEDWVDELRATVEDAVAIRLRADVRTGVALSGGIDSSIISTIARARLGDDASQLTFFSAVHPGHPQDESRFIDTMAEYLDIPVARMSINPDDTDGLRELLVRCSWQNDGPVASMSNVLFYLLMQEAVKLDTTVVLTGQGADEAFCGYRKYPMLELKRLLRGGHPRQAARHALPFLRRGTLVPQLNLATAKRYFGKQDTSLLGEATAAALRPEALGAVGGSLNDRAWLDLTRYSVPYLTHYEDRMSMAWSREVRAPFLDYRVVRLGVQAPTDFKMRDGWTKYGLRKAFESQLPPSITWRKDKMGFASPEGAWMKTALRPDLEALIADPNAPLFTQGLVDRGAYRRLYDAYLRGERRVWVRDVFAPFVLNLWLREFGLGGPT
jgi:asparagine synthase (glutamine-hydrolysing)